MIRRSIVLAFACGAISGFVSISIRWYMVWSMPEIVDTVTLIIFPALIAFLIAPTGPNVAIYIIAIIAFCINGLIYATIWTLLIIPLSIIFDYIVRISRSNS